MDRVTTQNIKDLETHKTPIIDYGPKADHGVTERPCKICGNVTDHNRLLCLNCYHEYEE